MANRLCFIVVAAVFAFSIPADAQAHEIFQDVLKEQYMLKSFSCKTCHPNSKDRKIRTKFADRIYQQLKAKNYTEKFAVAVAADEAAKAKDPKSVTKEKGAVVEFDKMIAVEFKKAFKEVAKQTMTFDDMLKQGLLSGARLDTKKIEAAKKEKEAEAKTESK